MPIISRRPSRTPLARRVRLAPLALLIGALALASPAAEAFQTKGLYGDAAPALAEPVGATLIADVEAIEPGIPFRLGVLFDIESEWHIYWRTAGGIGYPTTIEWKLPEGFTAGELQWPSPHRFVDDVLGVVSYGYEKETLLFVEVTPPANLESGDALDFGARADWLMCRVECIPGMVEASIALSVGASAPSAERAAFDRFAAQTPRPARAQGLPFEIEIHPPVGGALPGVQGPHRVHVRATGDWRLLLESDGERAELYPDEVEFTVDNFDANAAADAAATPDGAGAYDAIHFDWVLEIADDAEEKTYPLRPSLRLPAVHVSGGATRTFHVALNYDLTVGDPAAATQSPAPAAEPPAEVPVTYDAVDESIPDQQNEAWLSLVADTAAIEPGKPFRLGLLFEIEPDWHTYWRYDPIAYSFGHQFRFDLPEGFEIGPVQWPNPSMKYDDLLGASYYYDEEQLLIFEVTPPDDLDPGAPVSFRAQAGWLTCHDELGCVPGSGIKTLELPVGSAAPSAFAAKFDEWAELVPVALPSGDAPVEIAITPAAGGLKPGDSLDQNITVTARGPWRLLIEDETTPALMFPDRTDDIEPGMPTAPSGSGPREVHGATAYDALAFDWSIEIESSASDGLNRLAPAFTLPMIHEETGERRVVRAVIDRLIVIGGSGPAVALLDPATDAAPGAAASGDFPTDDFAFALNHPEASGAAGLPRILSFLILAFLGGMILNVMPCVLPVLSLKIMGFVHQAGENRARTFQLGLVFALGVWVSFLVLAGVIIALQRGGDQVGWGFQLQEPRFVIAMAAIMFVFGLSLLNVFTIDLPGSAAQGLDKHQRREGPAGAFFNGAMATLLATPCTAPLLAPALGFAFSQTPVVIVLFFTTIAFGMALPYVMFSAFPALLRFVPKPGPWMETFKKIMGLTLLGFVIWLLWVIGGQTGADGVIVTICFLMLLGVGCMLINWGFDLSAKSLRRWGTAALVLMLAVSAYAIFPETYLRALAAAESGEEPDGVIWEPFSFAKVNQYAAEGRPMFIDFTADWCMSCKVNERVVLAREDVEEAFLSQNVATMVVDWTKREPEIGELLMEFGRAGVPMYLIFPADNPSDYTVLPTVLTPGIVIDAVKAAAAGKRVAKND